MITFENHPEFEKELHRLIRKYRNNGTVGFDNLQKLLEKQFAPVGRELVIGPGKIHKIHEYVNFSGQIWKVEMSVSGLRPSQWPRVWFLLAGEVVHFLHTDSHQNNYNNKTSELLVKERAMYFNF